MSILIRKMETCPPLASRTESPTSLLHLYWREGDISFDMDNLQIHIISINSEDDAYRLWRWHAWICILIHIDSEVDEYGVGGGCVSTLTLMRMNLEIDAHRLRGRWAVWGLSALMHIDWKKLSPLRGFPIYYVPSSRTVSKRTPLKHLFQILRGGSFYSQFLMREHSK